MHDQGWDFAHSLRLLRTNERLWANCSDCSGKKSDSEKITQAAHDKQVTMSEWLSSLCKKERHEWFACDSSKLLSKMSNSLRKKTYFMFLTLLHCFPFLYPRANLSRRSSLSLYKRVTVSDLLPSFMTKERRARFALFHEQIALSLTKNERFAWKTYEQILNPGPRV